MKLLNFKNTNSEEREQRLKSKNKLAANSVFCSPNAINLNNSSNKMYSEGESFSDTDESDDSVYRRDERGTWRRFSRGEESVLSCDSGDSTMSNDTNIKRWVNIVSGDIDGIFERSKGGKIVRFHVSSNYFVDFLEGKRK